MHFKNRSLLFRIILIAGVFFSCDQHSDKAVVENILQPIPVIVNDSSILSLDKSPMDISYFPAEYPKQKMLTPDLNNLVARVIYSRPQKNGRIIFADSSVRENFIQHYGQEWRLGANEATEIEFFKDVLAGDKKISKGRYIIYCIPFRDKWKIIFNSNLFSWGLHMDKTKDISEMELPVNFQNTETELFTMIFQKAVHGCDLVMSWGNMKVIMPISFN